MFFLQKSVLQYVKGHQKKSIDFGVGEDRFFGTLTEATTKIFTLCLLRQIKCTYVLAMINKICTKQKQVFNLLIARKLGVTFFDLAGNLSSSLRVNVKKFHFL